ncbi:hypothetical protein CFD26_104602 [Aspergillus turcosus]|uniref:Uncharacterized protein n=1 Tax=Aspergillus turcosus TaxID=1245748 RepID=A0A421CXZ2_9EURO|nr:hypothetical protein CFD26_104602 [Aspergillus turcosus]
MVRFINRTLSVLLLVLCVFGSCWIHPRDTSVTSTLIPWSEGRKSEGALQVLHERQTSNNCADYLGDENVPECEALCAPSSFSCSSSSLDKRYVQFWPSRKSDNLNETAILPRVLSAPVKREFTTISQQDVATYIPNQFNGNYDDYFGVPTALVETIDDEETDNTVVMQIEFGNEPFQVGSAGLHGCTMVTIVSDRAVYMGHFWEVPSWSSTTTEFNERVLNFFSGGGQFGIGPTLNPALFTADDNTRVYIMTPRRTGGKYTTSNYIKKVPVLISTIKTALGNQNVPVAVWKYVRLNWDNPNDAAQINRNQRGIALFQFDPDASGTGTRGWRLFYEEMQFSSTDPPPGPASENGVPPLPPLSNNAE